MAAKKKDPWDEAKTKQGKPEICAKELPITWRKAWQKLKAPTGWAKGTKRMQRICWRKVPKSLTSSRLSLSKGQPTWLCNKPRTWPDMQAQWPRTLRAIRKTWTCSVPRHCPGAAVSGEGLAKKEDMQDPCQKGSWSLGKRFPVGCLGLCAQKGCAPLPKGCLTRPCPKGSGCF